MRNNNNSIIVKELNSANKDYARTIAELHKEAFPSFFLTKLGLPFLHTLYTGYIEDEESGVIIAEYAGDLVGFIAFSKDYSGFFKGLIKNHLIKFAVCSLGAVIRHPSFIKRILRAFKKSESVIKEEKYVELASICVAPQIRNRGIGKRMIDYLKGIVDFDIYEYINLETDAKKNDDVNKFYMENGFILARQYITAEGRIMNEYRYGVAI